MTRTSIPGNSTSSIATAPIPGQPPQDAVLVALIGRRPQCVSASVPGWRAASLEGRVYPRLVAAPGSAAPGMLFTDLNRREWAILDAFEDDRHDLREVTLTSGGRGLAFVWPDGEVRDEDWDAEAIQVPSPSGVRCSVRTDCARVGRRS
ncbi:gamma-glutamylcyclotransferase family protein [Streptomyces flaveus]|uniref:gamma-glutamylcyclotransferase family protein n=1 Tax=Streptomyces flaveus TaxID=66370 RepID=UPI0033292E4A